MHDVEVEDFLNHWWAYNPPILIQKIEDWIETSYLNPPTFLERIFAFQESIFPPSKSEFGKHYDFYHDCVFRHVTSRSIAFSIINKRNQTEEWSYEDLHRCVNYHVSKWSSASPLPGQTIAIVMQPGIHFFIALLTAFRFGLKICYLPHTTAFLGDNKIIKLLSDIKPNFITTEERIFAIDGIPLLAVDETGQDNENHKPYSFAYEAKTELLLTLALYRQDESSLVPVDAQYFYLHALRDAICTLNLKQYSFWAAPLSCPIATEPCSTILSLLSGATRVYVPNEAIQADPQILEGQRINLLGISQGLQKLWSKAASIPTRYLKCCYKSFLNNNQQEWHAFAQLHELTKIPLFHIHMDNSIGGISLFTKPAIDNFNYFLKPTLGTAWQLENLNGSGEKSLTGYGIFNAQMPCVENNLNKGNFILAQIEKNYVISGNIEPCRNGITYPIEELEESVNNLDFVEACMIHPIKKAGVTYSHHFLLLVFVNPAKQNISEEDEKNWSSEIAQRVTSYVGKGFLPDQIEYYPLLPKMHQLEVLGIDRNWCANQFDSGLLKKKINKPLYQVLNVLKKLVIKHIEQEKSYT